MKILFLCNANKCCSPLAEGLLKEKLNNRNISAMVDSAGFEVYHVNEPPDKRAIKMASKHGIDISTKKVRLFNIEDFQNFDQIYVMDTNSYRNAMYFAQSEEDKSKVDYLMNVIHPDKNDSFPDPFYRKLDACSEASDIMNQALSEIADRIETQVVN